EQTKDEDTGVKKQLYEEIGVREYFLFDPRGDYLPRQLIGYVLHRVSDNGNGLNGVTDLCEIEVRSEYQELPETHDGSLVSRELGLRMVPNGKVLDLFDLTSGEQLLAPEELLEQVSVLLTQLDEEKEKREAEKKRAENEKKRADTEKTRADTEKTRADTAEKA